MNTYIIEHSVKTTSMISSRDKLNIDWFIFTNQKYNASEWSSLGLLIKKEVEASTWMEAIDKFRTELKWIVDKISFLIQWYIDFFDESRLIHKRKNNQNNWFICFLNKWTEWWSLDICSDTIIDLNNISSVSSLFYDYIHQANNTYWNYGRLWLLFWALEALAWKKVSDKHYPTYDKKKMELILWSENFKLFFWSSWLRNKLQHWGIVEESKIIDSISDIYIKIFDYFSEITSIEIEKIIGTWRHPFWNKSWWQYSLRVSDENIELIDLEELYKWSLPTIEETERDWYVWTYIDRKSY